MNNLKLTNIIKEIQEGKKGKKARRSNLKLSEPLVQEGFTERYKKEANKWLEKTDVKTRLEFFKTLNDWRNNGRPSHKFEIKEGRKSLYVFEARTAKPSVHLVAQFVPTSQKISGPEKGKTLKGLKVLWVKFFGNYDDYDRWVKGYDKS